MLQKPYHLQPTGGVALDGKDKIVLSWSVSGDIQTAIEIKIYDNKTNALVWSLQKTSSYSLTYTLPSSTLANGKEYKWQVIIYNDANKSIGSDFVIFQTSSRPVITANQITTIPAPSYQFTATYSQVEKVPLRSWQALLYNEDSALIAFSGIQTQIDIAYLFENLMSEHSYFIEFQVTSSKGLTSTSGRIKFDVLYTQPKLNVNLTAENVPELAGIQLSWNAIQIIGIADKTPPVYIDNEKIDLLNNRVTFSDGFSIDKDFTLKMWIEQPKHKEDLLIITGGNGQLKLQYSLLDERFHLQKIPVNGMMSSWSSESVSGTRFFICIRQVGTNMDVIASLDN